MALQFSVQGCYHVYDTLDGRRLADCVAEHLNAKTTKVLGALLKESPDFTIYIHHSLGIELRAMVTGKKTGRPLIEISQDIFEELCGIQCTLSEVASVFRCSEDTIERWCRRTYQNTFAETHKRYSEDGKSSLRRAQFKSALGGNATMQIWLGKQHLNQHDKIVVNITPGEADNLINQSGAPLPEIFHGEPLHSDESK